MNINTICNDLLDVLVKSNYHEHTIFNYIGVIRRFKASCEDKGITEYTPDFGKAYANDVISSKTKEFSRNRYHSQGRFIRMLNSYYNTGTFNFAILKRGKVEQTYEKYKKLYQNYDEFLLAKYIRESTVHFYKYELYYFLKDNRIFGMHMLRHNAASTMVKNEVSIATIAAILGHANTDTTDIYITTDESRLKECVLPMVGISTEVNP